jgi:hypothetical protein
MMTIDEIKKARRDLERRLMIDIEQFEKDTGVVVEHLDVSHMHPVYGTPKLLYVEVRLDIPK